MTKEDKPEGWLLYREELLSYIAERGPRAEMTQFKCAVCDSSDKFIVVGLADGTIRVICKPCMQLTLAVAVASALTVN